MHTVILDNPHRRGFAKGLVDKAPNGSTITIRPPKRTVPQNDKMWAMLTDVSVAKPEGREMTPDLWKPVFMQALGHEVQFIMGLDNLPFPVGFRSSHLSKEQMSDLIEFIYEYGARHGVRWTEPA